MIRTWMHYSAEPLTKKKLVHMPQMVQGGRWWSKPTGLWLTPVESDLCWKQWCRHNDYRPQNLVCANEVDVNMNNMLVLSTPAELYSFSDEYCIGKDDSWGSAGTSVNWSRVADRYDGIFISPYQWECRMDLGWYYTWDCDSGCVWNVSAIRDVRHDPVQAAMEMVDE